MLIKLSESTAARRRIYFTAVDETAFGQRVTGIDSWDCFISKNGAAAAATTNNPTEVDSGDMPGVYYIELTATEVNTLGNVVVWVSGTATGPGTIMEVRELIATVVAYDPYDAVRLGLTALPNANAEAAGGLYTRGTGAGQINQSANGQIDANTARWNNEAVDTLLAQFGATPRALAQSGTTQGITLNAADSSISNTYQGGIIHIVAGTGVGQNRYILSYNGSTKVAVVDSNWATTPDATSYYTIFRGRDISAGGGGVNVTAWRGTTPNILVSGRVNASVGAMDSNTITASALASDAAGEIADAVWDEARSGHVVSGSFGEGVNINDYNLVGNALTYLGAASASYFRDIVSVPDSTHVDFFGEGSESDDDLNGCYVYVYLGTGFGQIREITAWDTDGGSGGVGRATISPAWDTTPTGASIAILKPRPAAVDVPTTGEIADGVWDEARSGHATAGTFGEGVNVASIVASALSAIADAVWDEVMENSKTARQWMRGFKSALWGKLGITGTSRTFRDDADTKDRITAQVGPTGRTSITEDLT